MARFGIVEAAQRGRAWGPWLKTQGQRIILAGLVLYMGADSTSDPTIGQLAEWSGFTPRACRRILTELEESNVIDSIGERSKGRKATKWTIKPGPVSPGSTRTGESGNESQPGPRRTPTRTGEATDPDPAGSSSESSEISERECEHEFRTGTVGSREFTWCAHCGMSCNHTPMDEHGYCTACKAQILVESA